MIMAFFRPTVRCIALAAGAAAALASCAGRPAQTARPVAGSPGTNAPVGVLRGMAERQSARPDPRAMGAPLAPGLDPGAVERVAANPAAFRGLDDVAQELAGEPATPRDPAGGRDRSGALRLYASGREKLIAGDASGAVKDLQKAAELDPDAGEAWRELAEAQTALGWRTDAIASFEKALAAGLDDARVLERLGRAAFDKGDLPRAARLLSRASLRHPERLDPVLPAIIDLYLARTLASQGFIAASREATLRAAQRSPHLSASTRYGEDYGTVFRRQSELWRDIGDASCRLGEYARAAESYERAAAIPSLDGKDLTPRRVYAAMMAGNPASAALTLVARIEDGTEPGPGIGDLIRYVSAHSGVGPALSSAIGAYRATLPEPVPPGLAGALARARAAADPARAVALLTEHVRACPWDSDSLRELFNLAPEPRDAFATAAGLADASPRASERIAGALLNSRHPADQPSAERSAASPSGRLLAARFALARGLASDGADLAADPAQGTIGTHLALARLTAALAAGERGAVRDALATIEGASGPDADWCRMRAATAFQRFDDALRHARADLATATYSSRLEGLVAAAELAAALQRADDAESLLLEARTLDPRDDRITARLATLYGSGGIKADPAKLNQVLRQARRETPDARVLRAARVRDLLRRSLLEQAETEAVRLADEDPADPGAVELATIVWRARAARGEHDSVSRAESWLRAHLERRPGSPELLAGLATVLTATGRAADAERDLRAAIERGAPSDVRRMLEGLLRSDLNRPEEADALTLARLEGEMLTPAESFELAELRVRAGDLERAAVSLRTAFPAGVTVLPDQAARMAQLLQSMSEHAGPEHRGSLIGLFDLAAMHALRLPPELHERRLRLLAAAPETTADRISAAAEDVLVHYPGLNDQPFLVATRMLTSAGRGAIGLLVVSRAADRPGPHGPELYTTWMQAVALAGTAAHGRILIEHADRAGALKSLLDAFGEGDLAATTSLKAHSAYILGVLAASGSRDETAEGIYELALEYDAGHAWACNNLGYSLLERGERLDRAEELLERAHAALPGEASITDSLGWLRYKQGIIEDAGEGAARKPGALTLLQRAADGAPGQTSPTIVDHLGDAQWLAGQADQARMSWQRAEGMAHAELTLPRDPSRPLSSARVAELKDIRDRAAAKRLAAETGRRVRIAPTAADPDPQPRPAAPAEPAPANDEPRGGPRT